MLLLPAQIENVSTRADRTMKVTIGTQEATPQAAELVMLNQKMVYVAIKETAFDADEIEALEELQSEFVDDTKKRPSRRLRDVLFRVWEKKNKGFEDFNLFYLHQMDKMIDHFKTKLTPTP